MKRLLQVLFPVLLLTAGCRNENVSANLPRGNESHEWEVSPAGICVGGWGMLLCTEDLAKLGQLLLQRGKLTIVSPAKETVLVLIGDTNMDQRYIDLIWKHFAHLI